MPCPEPGHCRARLRQTPRRQGPAKRAAPKDTGRRGEGSGPPQARHPPRGAPTQYGEGPLSNAQTAAPPSKASPPSAKCTWYELVRRPLRPATKSVLQFGQRPKRNGGNPLGPRRTTEALGARGLRAHSKQKLRKNDCPSQTRDAINTTRAVRTLSPRKRKWLRQKLPCATINPSSYSILCCDATPLGVGRTTSSGPFREAMDRCVAAPSTGHSRLQTGAEARGHMVGNVANGLPAPPLNNDPLGVI